MNIPEKTLQGWIRRLDAEVKNLEKLYDLYYGYTTAFEDKHKRCGRKIAKIKKEIKEILEPTINCPWLDGKRIKESECPGYSGCKYRHDTCKEKRKTTEGEA